MKQGGGEGTTTQKKSSALSVLSKSI